MYSSHSSQHVVEEPQQAQLSLSRAFHVWGETPTDYPRQGERQILNSLKSFSVPHESVPRVYLADRNVESSGNIFHCFIALRDDADTLGNGFGCDRMVSSNHDDLERKQTAVKALPMLQSSTAQQAGSLETKGPRGFCSIIESQYRASLKYS